MHRRLAVGLAVAPDGTRYVADTGNHRIRRIEPDGPIGSVAGTGAGGDLEGDGTPAGSQLLRPSGLALGADGALYVADTGNDRIRRVALD